MIRTIIDVHVLQTVPPSNLNRDDTGSPKTAVYGGERRARVSSQAWKRATRKSFETLLDPTELGMRSKRLVELLAERIASRDASLLPESTNYAKLTVNATGIKTKLQNKKDELEEADYLIFLSEVQIEALANAAVEAAASGDFGTAIKAANLKAIANQAHSVDIALFGRMVAELPELNVDAAAQVAHAISVHGVE
nr:type I-E CRISPR-associated protein Cas7/Cse4/CasC [Actinomycetota bacterium]